MSDISEGYLNPPVLVSSNTPLAPRIVILIAIVSIIGVLLMILIVYYFLFGRGSKIPKMTQIKKEVGIDKEMEVFREDGAYQNYSQCIDGPGMLAVPIVNPGRSPNIFETVDEINSDEVPKLKEIVIVAKETCDESDSDEYRTNSVNVVIEFEDNECPPVIDIEEVDKDGDNRHEDLQSVKENTMYVSSLSLNMFSDCLEMSAEDCIALLPGGAASPSLSFQSAVTATTQTQFNHSYINASYINSSFGSTWSLGSSAMNTPVCRLKFSREDSSVLLHGGKDSLCDNGSLCRFEYSLEKGAEF